MARTFFQNHVALSNILEQNRLKYLVQLSLSAVWHSLLQSLHRARFYEDITWLFCCLVSITAPKIQTFLKITTLLPVLWKLQEEIFAFNSHSPCQEKVGVTQYHLFTMFLGTPNNVETECTGDLCAPVDAQVIYAEIDSITVLNPW